MGIKSRAALAIAVLLAVLGSMWLYGGLENHWDPCLNVYKQINTVITVFNGSDNVGEEDNLLLNECPGQAFQVSRLYVQLRAASALSSDILLEPYLSSWDELIRFIEALGPMLGLISQEIESKTSIIRELARQDAERKAGGAPGREGSRQGSEDTEGEPKSSDPDGEGSYRSVRSMIALELSRGVVDFHEQTDSGCRTLLRLHRALLWLQLFLKKLGEPPEAKGRLRSPSELCRDAYHQTLALHHSWLVRRAAELAFVAMPERGYFFRLVCVKTQEEATLVLNKVVRAIEEVYIRTQEALEEHGMLDLP